MTDTPERIKINEESGVHNDWFKEAASITVDTIGDFVKKLANNYEHDYGTIVHAMAAAAGATLSALNNCSQGGITGFQASCLMWQILQQEFHIEWPTKLVRYEHLLFPAYEYEFNAIPYDIWVWLRDRAKFLSENEKELDPTVIRHMKEIADGKVPYGFRIARQDEK